MIIASPYGLGQISPLQFTLRTQLPGAQTGIIAPEEDRIRQAATRLCEMRATGIIDEIAMEDLAVRFVLPLAAQQQQVIALANTVCTAAGLPIPGAQLPTPEAGPPAPLPPAPPAGMSRNTKIAIGVGLGVVGLGILVFLLR